MEDVPQPIRREAALLARRKKARSTQFTPEAPCEWRPQTVTNPADGNPFTPDGAWEFIADQLENEKQIVRYVELRKPPGKKAIVMIVAQSDGDVYIKVQLGSGAIKGRSFHYSTRKRQRDE